MFPREPAQMGDWLKDAPESLLRDLADLFVRAYAGIETRDPACVEAWAVLRVIGPAGRYIELKKAYTGPRSSGPWCWLRGAD